MEEGKLHWLNWNDFNSILGIEKAVICACLNFRTQMEMNSCSILRLVSSKCYSYWLLGKVAHDVEKFPSEDAPHVCGRAEKYCGKTLAEILF